MIKPATSPREPLRKDGTLCSVPAAHRRAWLGGHVHPGHSRTADPRSDRLGPPLSGAATRSARRAVRRGVRSGPGHADSGRAVRRRAGVVEDGAAGDARSRPCTTRLWAASALASTSCCCTARPVRRCARCSAASPGPCWTRRRGPTSHGSARSSSVRWPRPTRRCAAPTCGSSSRTCPESTSIWHSNVDGAHEWSGQVACRHLEHVLWLGGVARSAVGRVVFDA